MLLAKTAKSRFVPPFAGLRGNVHSSSMARWKARDRLPISANWMFASFHGWDAMSGYWSKSWFSKGGGSLWAKILMGRLSSANNFWRQKTRIHGLSRGVVCVILCLAVLIQYQLVIDKHTQTDRHTMTANTHASLAPHGQKNGSCLHDRAHKG